MKTFTFDKNGERIYSQETVRAINPRSKYLTHNRTYKVEWIGYTGSSVAVRDDQGKITPFCKSNFEKVKVQLRVKYFYTFQNRLTNIYYTFECYNEPEAWLSLRTYYESLSGKCFTKVSKNYKLISVSETNVIFNQSSITNSKLKQQLQCITENIKTHQPRICLDNTADVLLYETYQGIKKLIVKL